MNQKDYESIAGIIKRNNPIVYYRVIELVNELAEYFEREDKTIHSTYSEKWQRIVKKGFNKKKFLSDCGVKK